MKRETLTLWMAKAETLSDSDLGKFVTRCNEIGFEVGARHFRNTLEDRREIKNQASVFECTAGGGRRVIRSTKGLN